jgi:hypothetical protein
VAFKLSKSEAARRDELARALAEKADALRAKIEGYNDAMAKCWEAVACAVEEYNYALADARSFVEEVHTQRQGEYDDKSERWQEGERGEAAAAWLGEWEQPDLDDVELGEPEPVEEPDLEHAEALENLPEAAD